MLRKGTATKKLQKLGDADTDKKGSSIAVGEDRRNSNEDMRTGESKNAQVNEGDFESTID